MYRNEYDLLKKREFHYIKLDDQYTRRESAISTILGEGVVDKFISNNRGEITIDLHMVRYWKDLISARRLRMVNVIHEQISPSEFLKVMEPHIDDDIDDPTFIKNIRFYHKEIKIQERIKELRSNYKCFDAYEMPSDYMNWNECPVCGLRPMVWEYDNGRSTACGCGNGKYDHFRISAKSVGEYYSNKWIYDPDELRNNWNQFTKLAKL